MSRSFIRVNTRTTQVSYPSNRPVIIQTPINAYAELGTDVDGNTTIIFHGGITPTPHIVAMNFLASPPASALLFGYIFTIDVAWLADFAGSHFRCHAAPVRDYPIDLRLNNASIGTILFPAGSNAATITSVGHSLYSASDGDYLELLAPVATDTIAGIYGALLGSTGATVGN